MARKTDGLVRLNEVLRGTINDMEDTIRRDAPIPGLSTGMSAIDRVIGGLQRGGLHILAGQSMMGKTTLATNIATNVARDYLISDGEEGGTVAFFTLQKTAQQISRRILSRRSDFKLAAFQRKFAQIPALSEVALALSRLPLYLDDSRTLSSDQLCERALTLAGSAPLGLIVVDYLQLLSGNSTRRYDTRVLEVADVTRDLKRLARELDVPVLVVSSLTRGTESREDRRPLLRDLRDSGTIEDDADVIMFLFDEMFYLSRAEPSRRPDETDDCFNERYARYQVRMLEVHNTIDIIVAKNNDLPPAYVKLYYDPEFAMFGDLATE
jgi:replicative DNA helicase